MTKETLIEQVASSHPEFTKVDIRTVINTAFAAISAALQNAEDVSIHKFGTFDVREIAAHEGRNPRTGETVQIAAKKRVGFRASANLKELLN